MIRLGSTPLSQSITACSNGRLQGEYLPIRGDTSIYIIPATLQRGRKIPSIHWITKPETDQVAPEKVVSSRFLYLSGVYILTAVPSYRQIHHEHER